MSVELCLRSIYNILNNDEKIEYRLSLLDKNVQQLIGILSDVETSYDEAKKIIELAGRFQEIAQTNPQFLKLAEIAKLFSSIPGYVPPEVRSKQEVTSQLDHEINDVEPFSFPLALKPIRDNPIDCAQLKLWIEAHEFPKNKQALTELTQHIVHISQEQFEINLFNTVKHLNACLCLVGGTYVVAVEDGKSNRWVAQLAYPHLLTKPLKEISMVLKDYLVKYVADKEQNPGLNFPRSIVLFDDAAYSGEQLSRIIKGIFLSVNHFNVLNPDDKILCPRLIVACPYMTLFSQNAITAHLENYYIGTGVESQPALNYLTILPYLRIMTVKELITDPTHLSVLTQMWWPSEVNLGRSRMPEGLPGNRSPESGSPRMSPRARLLSQAALPGPVVEKDTSPSQYAHKQGAESRGTIYFSFKIPDKDSFLGPLAEGQVVIGGRISHTSGTFRIIPKTVPPYKPNFMIFCKDIAKKPPEG